MNCYSIPGDLPSVVLASILMLTLATGCANIVATVQEQPPIADAHAHYNWNQGEALPPAAIIERLKTQNVTLAVISSTPPELALQLKHQDPRRIIALFSPYLSPAYRRGDWYSDITLIDKTRHALQSGDYQGIGEVHLIPGLGPRRDNPVLTSLIELAGKFQVPFLLHTDASSYRYLLPVCQRYSHVQFVWAHAGGILPPTQVGRLLHACPNVMVDLSARDPLRYIDSPITNDDGSLLPGWRTLVLKYPDRFMVGSDALWPVYQMHGWFEQDTGWERLAEFLDFHRRWLNDLPPGIAEKIRLTNALRTYRKTQ